MQQLEKDIEELRCLRENTKLEHKELEEKLKKEQSTIVKQNDAITDLEQTIKSLQEKSLSSSLIVISDKSLTTDANKENIDTFQSKYLYFYFISCNIFFLSECYFIY